MSDVLDLILGRLKLVDNQIGQLEEDDKISISNIIYSCVFGILWARVDYNDKKKGQDWKDSITKTINEIY